MKKPYITIIHENFSGSEVVILNDWVAKIYNLKTTSIKTFPMKHPLPNSVCVGHVVNLFDIINIYSETVPESEDWYINYFPYDKNEPWDTDVRHQDHYKKKTVLELLNRLIDYDIISNYHYKDIIKHSYKGECESFFRPYYVVHVDFTRKGFKFVPDLYDKQQSNFTYNHTGFLKCSYDKY